MRLTFLGTGTSHGIPMIGCECAVCRSADPRNQRLRPSVLVEKDRHAVLIDATPDFRTQALRAGLRQVDAVLVTHSHADHVLGLDDLRVFTGKDGRKMPLYGSASSLADIQRVFPYACTDKPAWPGLPSFEFHPVEPDTEFQVAGLTCRALPLPHGRMTVYGFVLDRAVAYLTDCNAVPPETVGFLNQIPLLVLDALRQRPHPTHLTIADALAVIASISPQQALLTHLCHEIDHATVEAQLPPGVRLAHDQLRLEVTNGECRTLA